MVICKDCGRLFDSDADPDCFVEVGNMRSMNWTETVCRSCRDAREERAEHEADQSNSMPADWQPSAAQQAIIDQAESEPHDDEGRPIEDDGEAHV
jgi:hypothetical protein